MFGFILRNHRKGLVYSGDNSQLDYCLDPKEALEWWNKKPEGFRIHDYDAVIFGRSQRFKLPYFIDRLEDSIIITNEFLDYIINTAKKKLISDITLGIRLEVLKHFEVCKTKGGFVYMAYLQEPVERIDKKEKITQAKYVMMKEFMDGYSYFDKYEYIKGKKKIQIPISHTYEIDDVTIPYNYTLALRKAMFGANRGQNIGSNKLLMERQYDGIRRMAKKTIIFGPRRMGKTFFLGFVARREIMAQRLNFQNKYRPVTVIYVGLTDAKNYKVVQYLKGMDKLFSKTAEGMFHYSDDKKMYSFRSGKEILGSINFVSIEQKDPGIGDYADLIIIDEAIKVPDSVWEGIEPIITHEGAKLITASTLYYDAPKNRNYDLMLEAERNSMGKDIYKFIDDNFEKFRDLTKKKEWTLEDKIRYQELVNEFLDNNERAGLRYTIDDIEYMSEAKREAEKERMWNKNPQRYYAELYSRYADEGKVFNYNGCLVDFEKYKNLSYRYITTSHDSALTYDESAVLVGGWNSEIKKVVILEEHSIKKTGYYEDQARQIKEIIANSRRYSLPQNIDPQLKPVWDPNKSETYFICDGNQKATAELFQMAGLRIDLRMTYNSRGEHETKSSYIHNEISVPKKILIEIAQNMLENGFVLIPTHLKNLIKEFDGFYKKTDPITGAVKYSKGDSDDFIHAFIMLCYFFYEKLGLKYELTDVHNVKKIKTPEINYQEYIKKRFIEQQSEHYKKLEKAQEALNQIYFYNYIY